MYPARLFRTRLIKVPARGSTLFLRFLGPDCCYHQALYPGITHTVGHRTQLIDATPRTPLKRAVRTTGEKCSYTKRNPPPAPRSRTVLLADRSHLVFDHVHALPMYW